MNKKLIVTIDGADGAGKKTTAKELQEILEERGFRTYYMDFPDYSSNTGKAIKEYLTDPSYTCDNRRVISQLYTADRSMWMMKNRNNPDLLNADILLYNRSWISNLIYQTTVIPPNRLKRYCNDEFIGAHDIDSYVEFIHDAYVNEIDPWVFTDNNDTKLRMDQMPCLNFVIHTDPSLLDHNIKKRETETRTEQDLNDIDQEFQNSVIANYLWYESYQYHIFRTIDSKYGDAFGNNVRNFYKMIRCDSFITINSSSTINGIKIIQRQPCEIAKMLLSTIYNKLYINE